MAAPGTEPTEHSAKTTEAATVATTVPWRTILAVVGTVAGAFLAWRAVLALQSLLTWMVVAAFFAVVLTPIVDFLVYRLRLRRTLAALIVFLLGIATLAGLLYLLIQPIVSEVTKFVNDLPRLVQDAQAGKGTVGHLVKKYNLVEEAKKYEPKLKQAVQSSGTQALSILRRIGNTAVSALTIMVLTFLFLVEGQKGLSAAVGLLRPDRQVRLKRIGRDSSRAITGYMAGNVLISVIAAFVTYVGLWIFDVPFRSVAALWVGFADLIPLIGATLGAVPTVGLAFLHSVTAGVGMIIIYVVYQQFENHVLQVSIMSKTVRLSPLAVFVSLLAGVQLFGLLGALLAIPVGGIVQVVGRDILEHRRASVAARTTADATADATSGATADPPVAEGESEDTAPEGQARARRWWRRARPAAS